MYPKTIEETSEKIYECFEEDLVKIIPHHTSNWCKTISLETINKFLLPKFINGEELLLIEKEIIELYGMCTANLTISSLKEKGLVDTIENQNGEEIIFLTKEGKKIAEKLNKK